MQIGEAGDFYHWYPLFTADGGYAFARNADGSYNPDDMGVDSPGGVKAAETLQKLTDEKIKELDAVLKAKEEEILEV